MRTRQFLDRERDWHEKHDSTPATESEMMVIGQHENATLPERHLTKLPAADLSPQEIEQGFKEGEFRTEPQEKTFKMKKPLTKAERVDSTEGEVGNYKERTINWSRYTHRSHGVL